MLIFYYCQLKIQLLHAKIVRTSKIYTTMNTKTFYIESTKFIKSQRYITLEINKVFKRIKITHDYTAFK